MEPFNQRPGHRFSDHALALFHSVFDSHDESSLIVDIATLSKLFTKGRGELSDRYLDDSRLVAAYGAYFLPVNFAKIQILLDELPQDWADKPSLSVLDVGAGPGTASLAVRDWLRSDPSRTTPLHVTALDHSQAALAELTRLWTLYGRQTGRANDRLFISNEQLERLAAIECSSAADAHAPFDLIIAANSLNELYQGTTDWLERRAGFIARLLSALKPDGTLMILEPALRSTTRALHQIRDRVVGQGGCTVYSPCLHDGPCPALVKAEDWCHEERAWAPPPWIGVLDAQLGFIKDALKFSYLLLRKDGRTILPRKPDLYRVVSERLVFKGEQRAWLCNERGRSEVGRLNRKATGANADFDACHRGALVEIGRITRKELRNGKPSDLGRIEEDGLVKIVRGA